jgi:D-glycero-D-manno-heptose 1,7-bisphosphate phosphatase
MKKLIVLDRDGVINEDSDDYIKSPDEYIPIKGSLKAIADLNEAGYTVVVASNQSGIARGLFSMETLEAMHDKLNTLLAEQQGKIDKIYFCPHSPDENCDCRKPKPGMLHKIIKDYDVTPSDVTMIGDSMKDIEAASLVGMEPLLVCTGKGMKTKSQLVSNDKFKSIPIFADLAEAVAWIVAGK